MSAEGTVETKLDSVVDAQPLMKTPSVSRQGERRRVCIFVVCLSRTNSWGRLVGICQAKLVIDQRSRLSRRRGGDARKHQSRPLEGFRVAPVGNLNERRLLMADNGDPTRHRQAAPTRTCPLLRRVRRGAMGKLRSQGRSSQVPSLSRGRGMSFAWRGYEHHGNRHRSGHCDDGSSRSRTTAPSAASR